jgi:hypothetical protein
MSLSLTFHCQVMTMTMMMTTRTTGRMNTWHGSSKPWSCSPPSLLLVLSSPVGCTEEGYSLKGANTLRCNMSPPMITGVHCPAHFVVIPRIAAHTEPEIEEFLDRLQSVEG